MLIFTALCSTIAVPALFLWRLYFLRMGELVPGANGLLYEIASQHSPTDSYDRVAPVSMAAVAPSRRFHAHNDYEHRVPLFEALSYGAGSVEADIWLVGDELLVGHTEHELDPKKTLTALYLQPIMNLIDAANTTGRPGGGLHGGVFSPAMSLPLQLLIDIKSDGPSTFAKLYETLAPLRERGYLTTWVSGLSAPRQSLLTVVASGHAPLTSVQNLGHSSSTPRDLFLDAPLAAVEKDMGMTYTATLSPLASADFKRTFKAAWLLPCLGRRRMRAMVAAAHARGIQTRFWNTPGSFLTAYGWSVMRQENVDWLNVDDLAAAARFL